MSLFWGFLVVFQLCVLWNRTILYLKNICSVLGTMDVVLIIREELCMQWLINYAKIVNG